MVPLFWNFCTFKKLSIRTIVRRQFTTERSTVCQHFVFQGVASNSAKEHFHMPDQQRKIVCRVRDAPWLDILNTNSKYIFIHTFYS